MTRLGLLTLAASVAACGDLPTTSDGVAFLEIHPPASTTVALGATLQFSALALDKAGNPVDVQVRWRTPDPSISINEASGLVTGVEEGTGRVQAYIGNNELVSDFVLVTVVAPAGAGAVRPRP